ncbi:uncharacterized protein LOC112342804 [Selaginella moellendorffii]|uniref:uncharacterized protein LOC112342804 n=1 Tax=Selaginella moellendorffii TaxID=88036 RepID=UPI000D1C84E8|nr:uncharacterized protein LOC112342804 [Selaginella moellendorffii]|eukprot:XP_024520983.1 uncharacterized protein LOC112342804 [Selaginella moellendorffii]
MEEEEAHPGSAACDFPVLRVVGALERVRPLPAGRHSLLARIARGARSVLDHRPEDSVALNAERAMLLFSSAALGSRISGPLGRNSSPPGNISSRPKEIRERGNDPDKRLRLTGSHAIGSRTMVDSVIEGTSIQFTELRVRIIHTPPIPRLADGRISLTAGTDLRCRHRVAVESMMCSQDDKHSLSSIVSSTDFSSPPAWGIATSHKFARGLSVFSRYSNDHYAGKSVILQAVQRHGRNTISPICSVASKGRVQAGITWKSTIHCSKENGSEDFFQVKALWSQKGAFSVLLKAQLGDPVEWSQ